MISSRFFITFLEPVAYANGSFNQTEIEFKMDEQLNTITKDINEFGKISQKGVQTHVRLNLLSYFSTCPLL
jgi:hypothetical protein